VDQVPVWLFRQAGPYLPEYRQYKEDHGLGFLDIIRRPEAAAEVAMQPLRRYGLDAAILFSDILTVVDAMGLEVVFPIGKGIQVREPLKDDGDLSRLTTDPGAVVDRMEYVMDAVKATRAKLREEGFHIPLLGFSAAPWSLFAYMVGDSIRESSNSGRWAREHPEATRRLLRVLSDVVVEYLDRQIRSGAHAVQVFESLGENTPPQDMLRFALPELARIAPALKERHPEIPVLVFARGTGFANPSLQRAKFDVVTLDRNADRREMVMALEETAWVQGRRASVQGNLDPAMLVDGNRDEITEEVRRMVREFGGEGYIANLGAGLMGKEDPDLVEHYVNEIRRLSREQIQLGGV